MSSNIRDIIFLAPAVIFFKISKFEKPGLFLFKDFCLPYLKRVKLSFILINLVPISTRQTETQFKHIV